MRANYHEDNEMTAFTIFTETTMHVVCLPPPPPPKKKEKLIAIAFDFTGHDCNTQEKLETWWIENFPPGWNKV